MSAWSNPWPRQSGCARRPVIGVLCCNEFSQRPVQAVATRFVQPLADYAGAAVVLIPAVSDACDALALVDRLDGLLLTGSRSNVAATRYGAVREDNGPVDEQRDEVALRLAAHMIEGARPVFGICRGLQELNVLFGGTLTDALDDVHHCGLADGTQYERHFDHRHDLTLAPGGMLRDQAGLAAETVNSVHHQGIDRLGHGLTVEATAAEDGLIEAFSARPCGADVLAVQWHPEWDIGTSRASRAFFDRIGTALSINVRTIS
ncbi:gamma-glutamyl-gamma-aminobutyrate hydrolase family protein [Sphingomonas sp. H39-1-10]|uniref:gamma-glutamyl-gamma-aminobutyrate hydrolase family protein n=1 Tax=Sphingomonas pollutisoli TaxID=3030829 RepID=UPI0023BA2A52|nr:gamma-glutamyl-gamma-aminobutyrate hydrolase family protein [Sphingomonas pollutisoli]MDF0489383.1 gamma-glutamyl-gamma-aminobutyrate hydrolase family protein [Sphingomonas pollutisoli]